MLIALRIDLEFSLRHGIHDHYEVCISPSLSCFRACWRRKASQYRHSLLSNPKKFRGLMSPQSMHCRPSAGGASNAMAVSSRLQQLATNRVRMLFLNAGPLFRCRRLIPCFKSPCQQRPAVFKGGLACSPLLWSSRSRPVLPKVFVVQMP